MVGTSASQQVHGSRVAGSVQRASLTDWFVTTLDSRCRSWTDCDRHTWAIDWRRSSSRLCSRGFGGREYPQVLCIAARCTSAPSRQRRHSPSHLAIRAYQQRRPAVRMASVAGVFLRSRRHMYAVAIDWPTQSSASGRSAGFHDSGDFMVVSHRHLRTGGTRHRRRHARVY